jgi:hypothetical protein
VVSIAVFGTLAFLIVATVCGVLLTPVDGNWALRPSSPHPDELYLPLLYDPVGLIVVVMGLLTPLFCLEQAKGIGVFNAMNEQNTRLEPVSWNRQEINKCTVTANQRFDFIGRGWVSGALAVIAAGLSFGLYRLISEAGLLNNWNVSNFPEKQWRRVVYAGWWANFDRDRVLAIMLMALGAYLFYHVLKQLAMGMVFAVFMRATLRHEFGVTPNLAMNDDGYFGLRRLQNFMEWTYSVTLLDFLMLLGIFAVWLPFRWYTIFVVGGVMATNIATVLYPTFVARSFSTRVKTWAAKVIERDSSLAILDRDKLAERIWAVPTLPFRARRLFGFVTLYLLIPIALAVVSAALS